MKIPEEFIKTWEKAIDQHGSNNICFMAQINSRTLTRAVVTGECKIYIFNAINDAIISLDKRRDKILNKLLSNNKI